MDPQAMQQIEQMKQMQQVGTGVGVVGIIIFLVVYLFFAYCVARLAGKTGLSFGTSFIMAIIPIVNLFLILKIAAKPMWWFILLIIPIVNIVVSVLVWMAIAERLGKPGWWGIMISVVPAANIVFFLMLVFGKTEAVPARA